MDSRSAVEKNGKEEPLLKQNIHRRKFLLFTGAAASTALAGVVACKKNNNDDNEGVNLGSGDNGVLNYAYALE